MRHVDLMKKLAGSIVDLIQRALPFNRAGDRIFIILEFLKRHRRFPRRNTKQFNDYIYCQLTSDEILDPLRCFVTDKEFLKVWVSHKIGDRYNVPTLAVLRSATAASNFEYPDRCVIKPTHASGQIVVRKAGEEIDVEAICSWFKLNYYRVFREANYKNLLPKIIVEPILFDNDNLVDYKLFCIRGVPKLVQVDVNRRIQHARTFYSVDWVRQHYEFTYPSAGDIQRPDNLGDMLQVASRLSEDFSFVRVDLYSNGAETCVSELTHCPNAALGRFYPRRAERAASASLFD
jgi:TupA-like ATPgrasp